MPKFMLSILIILLLTPPVLANPVCDRMVPNIAKRTVKLRDEQGIHQFAIIRFALYRQLSETMRQERDAVFRIAREAFRMDGDATSVAERLSRKCHESMEGKR